MTDVRDPTLNSFGELVSENTALRAQLAGIEPVSVGRNATLYVWAVVILAALGMASILTVFIVRPDRDNSSVITVIIGFLVPLVTAFLAVAVQQVHLAVNSRLTQLLRLTAAASRAEGHLDAQKSGEPPSSVLAPKP